MIVSLRKVLDRLKFVALFLLLTYAMAHLLGSVSDWISPVDKYREPQGKAVKVFQTEGMADMEPHTFKERLRLFYWLGE
ncbi:YqzK family protein [Paenibacillus melissococcoides]|uniref:YqzK family protein n=1 Tax=Paenibacillus melissococcoides TaxID=2912268 RepID=A0ABM9G256_9BACL|nr:MULTISPECIES: DUF4227 family protein [Paenibacillus]MEB9895456.1 DUF4227 family protein [Bacillus cereus]CAH8245590.1 YqzK family protein [Paenibacillus melissococcoides]CAH8711400.1 YqzK family protein [Paenibacillus melissococcoides]CAH8712164.1 YqzK family protein [Paenibacillus melissococcoides]GIO76926.1 hypothetical protein J6TS7_05360 [Paenibacillus dendritiformis]